MKLMIIGFLSIAQSINANMCNIGQTRVNGCNTCYCNLGLWICTELPCAPVHQECRVGETKHVDCNRCVCDNGIWNCTNKECACRSGQTKRIDCNSCICTSGNWSCTKMFCSHKKTDDCVPGRIYQKGCNTCFCNLEGFLTGCTMMACN